MNDEHDTLQQYFTDRAPHLEITGADVATIARRGRARRHRRNAVRIGAVVGVLAIGGGIVVHGRTDDDQEVASRGAMVVSPLEWTVVDAPQGIGGLGPFPSATTSDGSIYQLSTGPASASGAAANRRVLYRSSDEVTWTATDLPDRLSASSLAADGDRLYAVGTAPAGGGVGVRLATSSGGTDWSSVEVPLDLAGLDDGFAGRVTTTATQVASARGTTVVAVAVRGELDATALPAGIDLGDGWGVTATGIDTYQPCLELDAAATTAPADAAARACKPDAADTGPEVARHWSWDELGLSAEQGALANGRTYLFAAADGQELTPAGVLAGSPWQTALLVAPEGFWLVRDQPDAGTPTTTALLSADGRDWSGPVTELAGYASAAGLVAGRPTIVLQSDGRPELATLTPGGPQVTDLGSALGGDRDGFVSSPVAIGPLGVAFTYTTGLREDGTGGRTVVVHTADGTSVAEQELPAPPAGRTERVNNVSVSADAITVRLNSYPEGTTPGDGGTRPTQRAFVGTPG